MARYVYEPQDGAEFSLKIKKSSRVVARNSVGEVLEEMAAPAIYLKFFKPAAGGTARAVLDDNFAKAKGYELEDLRKLVEMQGGFGTTFFCIESPKTKPEDKVETSKHRSGGTVNVEQGVRTTRGK